MYMKSMVDAVLLWGILFINIMNGLHQWRQKFDLPFLFLSIDGFLLLSLLLIMLHTTFREIHRRYDWAQLWMKVRQEVEEQVELIME